MYLHTHISTTSPCKEGKVCHFIQPASLTTDSGKSKKSSFPRAHHDEIDGVEMTFDDFSLGLLHPYIKGILWIKRNSLSRNVHSFIPPFNCKAKKTLISDVDVVLGESWSVSRPWESSHLWCVQEAESGIEGQLGYQDFDYYSSYGYGHLAHENKVELRLEWLVTLRPHNIPPSKIWPFWGFVNH